MCVCARKLVKKYSEFFISCVMLITKLIVSYSNQLSF